MNLSGFLKKNSLMNLLLILNKYKKVALIYINKNEKKILIYKTTKMKIL